MLAHDTDWQLIDWKNWPNGYKSNPGMKTKKTNMGATLTLKTWYKDCTLTVRGIFAVIFFM